MGHTVIRVRVRVPAWALAAGMPPPRDDESFDSYWRRAGVDEATIEMAVLGLDELRVDVANERMGTYLMRKMPDAFNAHVDLMGCRCRRPVEV